MNRQDGHIMSEDILRTVLDSATDIMFILNANSEIIQKNTAASRLLSDIDQTDIQKFSHCFSKIWDRSKYNNSFTCVENVEGREYEFNVNVIRLSGSDVDPHTYLIVLKNCRPESENSITSLINTLENERQRIAMDLHDSFGQKLTALKLFNQHIQKRVDPDDKKTIQLTGEVDETLNDCLNELKGICNSLDHHSIKHLPIIEAIKEGISAVLTDKDLDVKFNVYGDEHNLPIDQKITIVRIIQEFITNSIKHAECSGVGINVSFNDSSIELEVSDNGKGFDIEKALISTSGNGLKNIISRVQAYDGEYSFNSIPGEQTKLNAKFNY